MQQNTIELKTRAKRLRAAIKSVLGVDASNSQVLELVAREDNYPTWDAVSACAKQAEQPALSLGEAPVAKRLDEIGLPGEVVAQIKAMLASDGGLFLLAGPNGSGQSTTLASVVAETWHISRCKVATLENPVERVITGAQQYVVAEDNWLKAASAIMRSVPEVAMVGELRDALSCEAAIKMAQAGTQVWTGIKIATPSPGAVMEKLRSFGATDTALAMVRGIVWQTLTKDCRIEASILLPLPQ